MRNWLAGFVVMAVVGILVSCGGDKDKQYFETLMDTFRSKESTLVNHGCYLEVKDVDNITLDCTNIASDSSSKVDLRNYLVSYVSAGRQVLDFNDKMGKRYLDATAVRIIERKLILSNQIRGNLSQ